MASALSSLPKLRYRNIVLLTRNKGAALALRQPRQQSGQEQLRRIYHSIKELRRKGNTMITIWLPSSEENELLKLAKQKAKATTQRDATPQTQLPCMRSTTLNIARCKALLEAYRKRLVNTPKGSTQHSQANIRDNYTTACHGKKPAYLCQLEIT